MLYRASVGGLFFAPQVKHLIDMLCLIHIIVQPPIAHLSTARHTNHNSLFQRPHARTPPPIPIIRSVPHYVCQGDGGTLLHSLFNLLCQLLYFRLSIFVVSEPEEVVPLCSRDNSLHPLEGL